MIAFGHTAVGSVIGLAGYSYFGPTEPLLGLTLTGAAAVLSHYPIDALPHGHLIPFNQIGKKAYLAAIFDFGLSSLLFLSLAFYRGGFDLLFLYLTVGIFGSNLPDMLDGLIYTKLLPTKGLLKVENKIHELMHWHGAKEKALVWSKADIWQIVVVLISLYLLTMS